MSALIPDETLAALLTPEQRAAGYQALLTDTGLVVVVLVRVIGAFSAAVVAPAVITEAVDRHMAKEDNPDPSVCPYQNGRLCEAGR